MTDVSQPERRVRVFADAGAVAAAAAHRLEELALTAVQRHGRFTLALSGGSTPRALYQVLSERPELPWSHMDLCFGDERAVPPGHEASNARMVERALTHRDFVPKERVHRIRGELPAAEAARDYEQTLRNLFPDAALPRFDLILLGLGADGHTASLFPGSPALLEADAWVVAQRVDTLDTERITLTFPVLNAAAQVLFLVSGADKANALHEVIAGNAPVSRIPARGVLPQQGIVTFFVDEAAVASHVNRL
jgi:6-phosphogluconolactonase